MPAIRQGIALLMAVCVISLFGFNAAADKIKPLNLDTMTEAAGIIFEGECTSLRSGKDPKTGLMTTWFTFRITQGIKGDMDDEYVLKQYGGTDGKTKVRTPSVRYRVGEKIVLFLYGTSKLGFSSAVGMQQGKFNINNIPDSKTRYATNGMPAMLLYQDMKSQPTTVDAKGLMTTGSARLRSKRMELTQFLSEIKQIVKKQELKKKLKDQ